MGSKEDDRSGSRPQQLPHGATPQHMPGTGTHARGWRPRGRSPFLAGTTRTARRRFSPARRGGGRVMIVFAFIAKLARSMITPLKADIPAARRFRLLLGITSARTRRVPRSSGTRGPLALRTVGRSRRLAGPVRRTGRARPWLASTVRGTRTRGTALPRAVRSA